MFLGGDSNLDCLVLSVCGLKPVPGVPGVFLFSPLDLSGVSVGVPIRGILVGSLVLLRPVYLVLRISWSVSGQDLDKDLLVFVCLFTAWRGKRLCSNGAAVTSSLVLYLGFPCGSCVPLLQVSFSSIELGIKLKDNFGYHPS